MDMKTAISENYGLYSIAETMNNNEAGEFGDDILSPKLKKFVSSLDIDEYGALLDLYNAGEDEGDDANDWLERIQRFTDSLSDEQKELLSRIL